MPSLLIPTYVRNQSLQLRSIDSCQIKVSADRYHVAISQAHMWSSSRLRVFVKLTADQMMVFYLIAGSSPSFSQIF